MHNRLASLSFFWVLAITLGVAAAEPLPPDLAEQQLLKTLAAAQAQNWVKAAELGQQLCTDFPHFRAARLLCDHIAQRRRLPLQAIMRVLEPEQDEYIETNLIAEVQQRFGANANRITVEKYPQALLLLDAAINHALLVDTGRSRLYLLRNDNGRPRIIADYYAGIGKQGPGKVFRGDHRTPLGVYTVVNKIPDAKLPELYGIGAMPIDYPNTWDKRMQRTGSGIWLHGVPRQTYSRPPFSSRGCVTLSNAIYSAILTRVTTGKTPIVIGESMVWLDEQDWQEQQHTIRSTIEQWRKDWASLDFQRYISHYSTEFDNGNEDFAAWKKRKQSTNQRKQFITLKLTHLNIFSYPSETDLIQVDFRQHYQSSNFNGVNKKRQYWRLEKDGRWRIVHEGER